jgi:hypothetical protein
LQYPDDYEFIASIPKEDKEESRLGEEEEEENQREEKEEGEEEAPTERREEEDEGEACGLTDVSIEEEIGSGEEELERDALKGNGLEDFGNAATACPSPTCPSTSLNWDWEPEEMQMDLSARNKAFPWGRHCVGVVVEQIRQPSTGKLVCYKVSPLCTEDPKISEMFLETENIHQQGDWIQFQRK